MGKFEIIRYKELLEKGIRPEIKINSSVEEIEGIITFIDQCEDVSEFEKAKSFCDDLVQRLPLCITTVRDSYFIRTRKNNWDSKGNLEVFSKSDEISVNPEPKYWGRFNKDDESIFYASLPGSTDNYCKIPSNGPTLFTGK